MAELEFQLSQLVTLAIGNPEVGAVNFNLLQKVLLEMLKMTDLDHATVRLTSSEAAKLEDVLRYSVKPFDIENGQEEQTHQYVVDPTTIDRLLEDVTQLKFDLEDLTNKTTIITDRLLEDVTQIKFNSEDLTNKTTTLTEVAEDSPSQNMRSSWTQINKLQEKVNHLEAKIMNDLDLEGYEHRPLRERLSSLEKYTEIHADQLDRINRVLDERTLIMKQFAELQKDMAVIQEKLDIVTSSSQLKRSIAVDRKLSSIQDQQSTMNNIISRLSSIQQDLDNLGMVTNNLTEDQQEKQMFMEAIYEQVKIMNLTKADKNNMEDILAAKADMSQMHRKVSLDHFENNLKEVAAQLEEAFNRLNTHEELWQEEVDDLKSNLKGKLDVMAFSPLKDYINEKLNTIQEKIKHMVVQHREGEAAGTKKKIIRDLQCISCDAQTVMRCENNLDGTAPPPMLPTHHSGKPYLSFKLDQVRKQQIKLPSGRKQQYFGELLHKPPEIFQIAPNVVTDSEHQVHRYVGGSHTTTTPLQRLPHTTNFYQTWAPIITAMNPAEHSTL